MKVESVVLVLCIVGTAFGVDEDNLRKVRCDTFTPKSIDLDRDWYRSVKFWFSPLTNKLDVYRVSRELLQKPAQEIPDHDIYYEACITYHPNQEEGGYTIKGFGDGESFVRTLETDRTGSQLVESDYKYGAKGNGTIVLTDNQSYVLNVICDRNTLVWNVWSVTQSLDPKIVSKVFTFTQNMGFYRENFVMIKYNYCQHLPTN